MSETFPKDLIDFIEKSSWTFAKTMPQWPHWYIVRSDENAESFARLVMFISETGEPQPYYSQKYIYFEHDGMLYWTMGSPVEETTVINRCEVTSSYEYRREHGTLPQTAPPATPGKG